jgi:hypothetical protein
MKTNADGPLTIFLQKDSPGKDKEANWLPRTRWGDLFGDAPVVPQRDPFIDSAGRRGNLEAAGRHPSVAAISTAHDPVDPHLPRSQRDHRGLRRIAMIATSPHRVQRRSPRVSFSAIKHPRESQ